ncbi:MAG TPA: hypothetical protein VNY05_09400 [Candidatus Acidoferrales bacterium]|nr:hypothetical protein [Candidatus Acidoferrales bacterium]
MSGSVGKMAFRRSGLLLLSRLLLPRLLLSWLLLSRLLLPWLLLSRLFLSRRGGVTNGRGAAARGFGIEVVRLLTAPSFLGEPCRANGQNQGCKKGDIGFHII